MHIVISFMHRFLISNIGQKSYRSICKKKMAPLKMQQSTAAVKTFEFDAVKLYSLILGYKNCETDSTFIAISFEESLK